MRAMVFKQAGNPLELAEVETPLPAGCALAAFPPRRPPNRPHIVDGELSQPTFTYPVMRSAKSSARPPVPATCRRSRVRSAAGETAAIVLCPRIANLCDRPVFTGYTATAVMPSSRLMSGFASRCQQATRTPTPPAHVCGPHRHRRWSWLASAATGHLRLTLPLIWFPDRPFGRAAFRLTDLATPGPGVAQAGRPLRVGSTSSARSARCNHLCRSASLVPAALAIGQGPRSCAGIHMSDIRSSRTTCWRASDPPAATTRYAMRRISHSRPGWRPVNCHRIPARSRQPGAADLRSGRLTGAAGLVS